VKLNSLRNNVGSCKSRRRVGRGIGSGVGKTCGRGHKGQKSRTGVSIKGFEGGQNPLHMRLPKRGFNNIFAKKIIEVNLGLLQSALDRGVIDSSKVINLSYLKESGLVKGKYEFVKILAGGKDFNTALVFNVYRASVSAKKSIEYNKGVLNII
jgi:large subunit ribosomal protein L15